jgi:hypothetical protein
MPHKQDERGSAGRASGEDKTGERGSAGRASGEDKTGEDKETDLQEGPFYSSVTSWCLVVITGRIRLVCGIRPTFSRWTWCRRDP